jgi:hypothetical protein
LKRIWSRLKPTWPVLLQHPFWLDHAVPLLLYALLSLALTWPMVATFTSQIPGTTNDAHNGLWVMWHVKEALRGAQPLFDLPLLYYPHGATLLTHVPGPLTGLFALPFWPWGPEAAHNGAVLVSFTLTGYFMYLLARTLHLARPTAVFAGVLLLAAPMHLVGLWGHTTKVFLGATPLALLALHRLLDPALSPQRAAGWAAATAVALLATLLHDSFQLIATLMAFAFFLLVAFVTADPLSRPLLLRRALFLAAGFTVIVGPLLLATAVSAYDPTIVLDHNRASYSFQPDLVEFFLPPKNSALLGRLTTTLLHAYGLTQGIETAVSLTWTGLALAAVALARGRRPAQRWLLFTALFVFLSLGPSLKALGRLAFTEYELPIILPYAFLTGLPGLDFLRTPGRFMQTGYVGLAVVAGFGLEWLLGRWPARSHQAYLLTAVATLLLLLEQWPQPWPHLALRPAPPFYHHIAGDDELYGVLDLPFTPLPNYAPIVYNSHYQIYQMTHRKGIAMGYISRTYAAHPVLPCLVPEPRPPQPDVLVNGRPTTCYANALFDLATANYRYVVWHKPQPWYTDYTSGSWGEGQTADLITQLFGERPPLLEDDLARVYAVPPATETAVGPPTMGLLNNWYSREDGWRWARSPATLILSVPQATSATLQITPTVMYEPAPEQIVGRHGLLRVEMADGQATTIELRSEETAEAPLQLPAGVYTLTLSLAAGNFRPDDYSDATGETADTRWLSFAIRAINLQTHDP